MKMVWEALEAPGRNWKVVYKGLALLEHLIKYVERTLPLPLLLLLHCTAPVCSHHSSCSYSCYH